jgi:L-amino acid N-acyltransferase YncA
MDKIAISKMTAEDWPEVSIIYKAGISTKNATFETDVPDWDTWDKTHRSDCRLSAKLADIIVGWATLSYAFGRVVYSGVAEVSIYVLPEYSGKGIGKSLINALISESEQHGVWTLQECIFPENKASIKIHENHGLRLIGIREKIGKMDGTWRDVAFYERRSTLIGVK